jgi:hypothetical protein
MHRPPGPRPRDRTAARLDKSSGGTATCDPRRPLEMHLRGVRIRCLGAHRLAGSASGASSTPPACCLMRCTGRTRRARTAGRARPPHAAAISGSWPPAMTPVRGRRARLWHATALQDYDELVDCPVEMGAFWSGMFKAGGVPHRFVVAGAPAAFDGERLLARHAENLRGRHPLLARRQGAAAPALHCSCSTPWTTATAAWNTATPPR